MRKFLLTAMTLSVAWYVTHSTAKGVTSEVSQSTTVAVGSAPSSQNTSTQPSSTQPATTDVSQNHSDAWWKHAVFYEIYPRSFGDAKNTGMGNIAGITEKLDYLKDLGIDAIWITPCYPSPQVDFGYDISDYCNIGPEYGSLKDFDKLAAEAKKRDIKIIMDLVMNHTSDKHPWFVESASSKNNPKRDWYMWRDGKGDQPPNNWQSVFGHSAWKYDPKTKQYYYHMFYAEQPDLNWHNPEVRKAMYDTARFWLDRGVSGFRLDAIQTLFEDPNLSDNPTIAEKTNQFGDPKMVNKYNHGLPEVHDVLRELRQVLDSYPGNRVLIGETSAESREQLAQMYGRNHDEIQLPMNFFFADVNELSAPRFRTEIAAADANTAHGWPVYLFSNHDQVRHYNRYGDGKHNDDIAKLMAALNLTLRGTPILYYGEEIGMENSDPKRVEDVKDPIGRVGWPKEKGRDGERTPMQWTAEENAGFSVARTWLPVAPNYRTHNVATEQKDPQSILSFYKSLIKLRKSNDALINGQYVPLNNDDPNVLSYLRKTDHGSVLVTLNMSAVEQHPKFDLSAQGLSAKECGTLLSTDASGPASVRLDDIQLPAYGVYIGALKNSDHHP